MSGQYEGSEATSASYCMILDIRELRHKFTHVHLHMHNKGGRNRMSKNVILIDSFSIIVYLTWLFLELSRMKLIGESNEGYFICCKCFLSTSPSQPLIIVPSHHHPAILPSHHNLTRAGLSLRVARADFPLHPHLSLTLGNAQIQSEYFHFTASFA